MRSRLFSKLCPVSLAVVFSGALFAIPLAPATVGPAAPGVLPAGGVFTGPIAYACPSADCSTTGGTTGTSYVGVYQEAGGTGTDFLYQMKLTSGDDYRIMTMRGFACGAACLPTVDVFFLASGTEPAGFATPAVPPPAVTVDRSADGDRIHFNWAVPPGFGPGVSNVMVIHTAHQGAQILTDHYSGSDTGTFSSKAFAPIPEPSFVGLFLGGLFGAGLFVARKYRIRQS